MGGCNSGRWHAYQKKVTVQECLTLSISDLKSRGVFKHDHCAGSITWSNEASIVFRFDMTESSQGVLKVSYALGKEKVEDSILLENTQPTFGGVRWWLLCPGWDSGGRPCRRRVSKLYLPPGKRRFACRSCHHLTYSSSQTHDKRLGFYRNHPDDLLVLLQGKGKLSPSRVRLGLRALV